MRYVNFITLGGEILDSRSWSNFELPTMGRVSVSVVSLKSQSRSTWIVQSRSFNDIEFLWNLSQNSYKNYAELKKLEKTNSSIQNTSRNKTNSHLNDKYKKNLISDDEDGVFRPHTRLIRSLEILELL